MHKFKYERHKYLKTEIWIHFLCWSIFIFSEVVVTGLLQNRFSHFLYYFIFYTINISLFYIHARALKVIQAKSNLTYIAYLILLLIIELSVYVLLARTARIYLHQIIKSDSTISLNFNQVFYIATLWRGIYFMLYATGYFYLKSYISKQGIEIKKNMEISELQNQILTIEKDYLRSQITPHLLFNTLNFIKYSSRKNPEIAEDAIDRFSEIMDYALESNKNEYESLDKELTQIDNIIALNQLRHNGGLHISYNQDITESNLKLIPVILLTIVENLFKHGNLSDPNYPAEIRIIADKNALSFSTTNLPIGGHFEKGSGRGLNNVIARLNYSYPNSHTFFSGMQGKLYHTRLRIQFQQ